jgi:hypothetical protein
MTGVVAAIFFAVVFWRLYRLSLDQDRRAENHAREMRRLLARGRYTARKLRRRR